MVAEAKDAWKYGVKSFIIFPKVEDHLKTNRGEEAYNPTGEKQITCGCDRVEVGRTDVLES